MRLMLVLALAAGPLAAGSTACSTRGPAGPAWPRPAPREADGGESLAPRAAARAIAAIVEDDHAAERAVAATPAAAPSPAASTAAAPAAATPAQDEPLPSEEIVIEVDD
ncbi:MAG TPA: hypothetical protein VHW23_04420 [Kofleriaceae bacterium]|jgi:hypothetical protein|nr:hypothetical protein [Kofleriaceae bacterium]